MDISLGETEFMLLSKDPKENIGRKTKILYLDQFFLKFRSCMIYWKMYSLNQLYFWFTLFSFTIYLLILSKSFSLSEP